MNRDNYKTSVLLIISLPTIRFTKTVQQNTNSHSSWIMKDGWDSVSPGWWTIQDEKNFKPMKRNSTAVCELTRIQHSSNAWWFHLHIKIVNTQRSNSWHKMKNLLSSISFMANIYSKIVINSKNEEWSCHWKQRGGPTHVWMGRENTKMRRGKKSTHPPQTCQIQINVFI